MHVTLDYLFDENTLSTELTVDINGNINTHITLQCACLQRPGW